MEAAISISNLVKEYPGSDKKRFRAVDGLSLDVRAGEILAFLGPNGAGKTTTIKAVLGLVLPDQGSVRVDGLVVQNHRSEVLRRVGAVLEGNRNIYWDLTVHENLRYWGTLKEVPPAILNPRIEELIDFFELDQKRKTIGKQLSRGMQQKLAIACSLIHDPQILLLDEPTLGLDVAAARMVKERVLQLSREQGRTVVLTTHELDVAQELCQRVAIINHGKLMALEQKENLLGMFSQHEYEFKVLGDLPEAELVKWGHVSLREQNGSTTFRILLHDGDSVYAVMDCLRSHGLRVEAIHKIDADLEDVFLSITEDRKPAGSREVQASA